MVDNNHIGRIIIWDVDVPLPEKQDGVDQYSLRSKSAWPLLSLEKEVVQQINEEVMERLLRFPHDRESRDQPLIGQWQEGMFNAWYYLRSRVFQSVRQQEQKKRVIRSVLDGPRAVTLHTDDSELVELLADDGLSIHLHPVSRGSTSLFQKLRTALRYLSYMWTSKRATMKLMKEASSVTVKAGKRTDVLIMERMNDRDFRRLADGSTVFVNRYLGEILTNDETGIDRLEEQTTPRLADCDFSPLPTTDGALQVEGVLLSKGGLGRWKKAGHYTADFIATLDKMDTPDNPIDVLIATHLRRHKQSLKMYRWRYLSFLEFFKSNTYRSFISIDEQGPLIRSIIDAAHSAGVGTFAVQHGAIHADNASHRYAPEDLSYMHGADRFFAWGDRWAAALVDQYAFDSSAIDIVGQQRTDALARIRNHALLKDRYILLATQPLPDYQLMKQYVADTLFALSELDYSGPLVIRPHPAEKDLSYIHALTGQHPDLQVIIDQETDLYQGLADASLVLTAYSTVGAEALYFDLPVIIYDYARQDLLGLIGAGAAYAATDESSLRDLLRRHVSGALTIDKEALAVEIAHSVYRIDGQVVDRIDKVIRRHGQRGK